VAIPGAAVPTALIGMTCGGLLTLPFIWKELRLLLDL